MNNSSTTNLALSSNNLPASHLPTFGYLRLHQIIGNPRANPPIPAIIPVSKSTWWQGVKDGRYPQPTRTLSARITAWKVEDIRALLASFDIASETARGSR